MNPNISSTFLSKTCLKTIVLIVDDALKFAFSAVIQSKMFREENVESGVLWCCIECGYSSKRKDHVGNHIESKHIVSGCINCEYCGKFCPNRNSLQIHTSRYHRGQIS